MDGHNRQTQNTGGSNFAPGQFYGASNLLITGGSFSQINYGGHRDAGLAILSQHIASGATFDSSERFPPGKCHPGTREKVLKVLLEWMNEPKPDSGVLWLYGPAGSGKSALAQSAVELLRLLEKERYGGSFFFARGNVARGDGNNLFSTLAYQLAVNFPSMRAQIELAMFDDPTLPTKSIDVQIQSLIIHPLLRCTDSWTEHSPTVIIDGLDECSESNLDVQCQILDLISQAIVEHHIPLRFLVTSRPEYWIRDTFETEPLAKITRVVSLRDAVDTDDDIEKYLIAGFEEIRLKHPRSMSKIQAPWPPKHVVRRFVEEASGQFIYASTVLKFVGHTSKFRDPREQLRIITTPGPHRASAFSDLDRLYATILSAYPERDTLKRVLGGLLAGISMKGISILLDVDPVEVGIVVDSLSSLIDVCEPICSDSDRLLEPIFGSPLAESKIQFCHLSFREFLEDEGRSGPFSIMLTSVYDQLVTALFKIIGDNLDRSYKTEPHISRDVGISVFNQIMDSVPPFIGLCNATTRERLFKDMALKIHSFLNSQDESLGPVLDAPRLIRDMSRIMWIPTINTGNVNGVSQELERAVSQLRASASQVQRKAVQQLPASAGFGITPSLVYLHISQDPQQHPTFDQLSNMPGNTTASSLSDLKKHPHSVDIYCDHGTGRIKVSIPRNTFYPDLFPLDHGENALMTSWNNLQVSLTAQCLTSLAMTVETLRECPDHPEMLTLIFNQTEVVDQFFSRVDISDFRTEESFRNPAKMNMLSLLMDPSYWKRLSVGKETSHFVCSALTWFNRQLTSPDSSKIIMSYDENLPLLMKGAMEAIFEQAFLPFYTAEPYLLNLWMYNIPTGQSVCLNFLPLSDGSGDTFYWEEDIEFQMPTGFISGRFAHFNDEFFGGTLNAPAIIEVPIFNRESWYPHLAAFLLGMLVKYLYHKIHPQFEGHPDIVENNFSHIIQCLPFACPTESNLASLRAIRYLYPLASANALWYPPEGFCSLTIDLLMQYDSSILPTDELDYFVAWLTGLSMNEVEASGGMYAEFAYHDDEEVYI